MANQETLTLKKVFKFWYPLAVTWLMMSVEGPLLAAIIARLPEAKYNLAAYGVAFAFALIVEAPVIMMLSASTALVKDAPSYFKLKQFVHLISGVVTAIMVLLLLPPVFSIITEKWMNLPVRVARLTHGALLILLPWPAAIGYRRFYQGILIRYNLTRKVAYGTAIRLSTMSLSAIILYFCACMPGALVGGVALTVGVTVELIASRVMVHDTLRRLKEIKGHWEQDGLTFSYLARFYLPLALTSFLGLAVQPLVTFMVGHSRLAIESLAVLPVINALIFIFRSVGLSFQEVAIALAGDKQQNLRQLKRFATLLGLTVTFLLFLIAFTPLAMQWYHKISGLTLPLAQLALIPTKILLLMPLFSVVLSFQRAIFVNLRKTTHITVASLVEIVMIFLFLYLGIYYWNLVGAVIAALALIGGRFLAILYLFLYFLKIERSVFNNW